MFWGLAKGEVDPRGFEFEHVLQDIQTLNEWALEGRVELTAIPVHADPHVQDRYVLLPHGASMGSGYGPIVVAREALSEYDLRGMEIAVPGRMTTAFLTLQLRLGEFRWREVPFDRIMDEVLSGEADAGLLIHEGQLTYGAAGLHKVVDLGEWWLEDTGLPLPLGANVARRDLGPDTLRELSDVLAESIRAGLDNRKPAVGLGLRGRCPRLLRGGRGAPRASRAVRASRSAMGSSRGRAVLDGDPPGAGEGRSDLPVRGARARAALGAGRGEPRGARRSLLGLDALALEQGHKREERPRRRRTAEAVRPSARSPRCRAPALVDRRGDFRVSRRTRPGGAAAWQRRVPRARNGGAERAANREQLPFASWLWRCGARVSAAA